MASEQVSSARSATAKWSVSRRAEPIAAGGTVPALDVSTQTSLLARQARRRPTALTAAARCGAIFLTQDSETALIEHSVVIERPLFDVFDYLMDVQRMWEWVPFCLNSKVLEIDELQWPTRYEARAGFTWEISYTTEVAITDVRRGRSVSFRQAEPPQMAIYTLQPTPTGTIVTATHSPWTTLLLAPLEGSFDVLLREYVSNALENLKKVLEARPPVSRPVVFLSYRRESSEYVAGRICEAIARDFGEAALFRDLDTIRAGENPYAAIDAGLADCAAMIVLIDPTWLESIERRREDGEK